MCLLGAMAVAVGGGSACSVGGTLGFSTTRSVKPVASATHGQAFDISVSSTNFDFPLLVILGPFEVVSGMVVGFPRTNGRVASFSEVPDATIWDRTGGSTLVYVGAGLRAYLGSTVLRLFGTYGAASPGVDNTVATETSVGIEVNGIVWRRGHGLVRLGLQLAWREQGGVPVDDELVNEYSSYTARGIGIGMTFAVDTHFDMLWNR